VRDAEKKWQMVENAKTKTAKSQAKAQKNAKSTSRKEKGTVKVLVKERTIYGFACNSAELYTKMYLKT